MEDWCTSAQYFLNTDEIKHILKMGPKSPSFVVLLMRVLKKLLQKVSYSVNNT